MIDRWGNSSEGVEGLDINENQPLSHENDRTPCDVDDNSKGHYHNDHFHYNHTYREHHVGESHHE